ncbi:MAG: hypothetical protein IAG13_30135 [Deltaproteobacteria bacterium]|nr:hypothetical protein [Nannocystaceae bacterium]
MRRTAFAIALVGGCTPVTETLDVDMAIVATDDAALAVEAPLEPVDDRLRELDVGPIRTHPLWPTPSNDECPAPMFASLGPSLNAGDMFRRTHARLSAIATSASSSDSSSILTQPRMTDLLLVRHHLDVPGLRLIAAMDFSSSCMMGWSHEHCFVTTGSVYCPGAGTSEMTRMVQELGLAPDELDPAGWFELVVVLLGVERMVLHPDRISACTRVAGAHTVAPEVTIEAHRVTVQLTAIENGAGVLHYVVIEANGRVHASRHLLWKAPKDDDDIWGELDAD